MTLENLSLTRFFGIVDEKQILVAPLTERISGKRNRKERWGLLSVLMLALFSGFLAVVFMLIAFIIGKITITVNILFCN